MLYPTHKNYGILWGLLTIPVAVIIGFIPIITYTMRFEDIFLIIMTIYMGMRGALFGAKYPDIDSPSSIPARKHPIIHSIFQKFGVKHRGKYSHDYWTIGATFLIIYILVHYGGMKLLNTIVLGNSLINSILYLLGFVFVYIIGIDIIDFFEWLFHKIKQHKLAYFFEHKRYLLGLGTVALLLVSLMINGTLDIKSVVTLQIGVGSAMSMTTMLIVCFKVYVLFALAGAYSHLFADMSTKEGVYLFGKKIRPVTFAEKIRKLPIIGRFLVPTDFKTGGEWEKKCNRIVLQAMIPAFILAILVLFGFDIPQMYHMLANR